MSARRGFTIVEVVVVMVIMAILLGFVMAGMSRYQVTIRDKERETDAEQLARGFEQRYMQGNPVITSTGGTSNYATAGGYPSIIEFLHIEGGDRSGDGYVPSVVNGGYFTSALPGTSINTLRAPGVTSGASLGLYCFLCGNPPENAAQLASVVTIDTYIYEPLTATGQQCNTGKCTRFNLYYRTEVDNTLHTIRSKHQ